MPKINLVYFAVCQLNDDGTAERIDEVEHTNMLEAIAAATAPDWGAGGYVVGCYNRPDQSEPWRSVWCFDINTAGELLDETEHAD